MGCDRAPLPGSDMIGAMHPSICRPVAEVLVGDSGDAAHSAPSARTEILFRGSLISFCIRSTDTWISAGGQTGQADAAGMPRSTVSFQVELTRQSVMPLTSSRTSGGSLVETASMTFQTWSREQSQKRILTELAMKGQLRIFTVKLPRRWGLFSSRITLE
jgi:hypothetical protein